MATPGVPSDSGSPLADLLGGINRPQLNSFVAQSQARNGLVSAQTQEAMVKASQAQEEQQAYDKIPDQLKSMYPSMSDSEAQLTRSLVLRNADSVNAGKFIAQMALMHGTPQQQVAGQQGFEGKIAGLENAPNNFVTPTGMATANQTGTAPVVGQTAQGAAQTAETNALAGLNTHKDINPQDFKTSLFGTTSPEGIAALTQAVHEGRLDPTRLNSRTAPIYAQMELSNPGANNYNRLHADATLQANSTFQQRAMSVDMLPGLLSNVTTLGKQLNGGTGYNDLKAVGVMQQVLNGQTNDPDYTEYMSARNDVLLRLASVMRGVGMSDQAHRAEMEAMAPTLSPAGLDAWMKGQMVAVKPFLERQNRITHLGEAGQGTQPLTAPTAAAPAGPAGPAPSNAPAASLPSFPDEASARAALGPGTHRVIIGGQTGTLQ